MKRYFLGALTGLVLLAAPAGATVIYSSFGPGHTYSCCDGIAITGTDGRFQRVAMGFTSGGNFDVDQIDVAVGYIPPGTNGAVVSLWTDSGGFLGSQLGTWTITGLPNFTSTSTAVSTIGGISGISLTSGSAYFLMVEPLASDTRAAWNQTSTGAAANIIFDNGAGWMMSADRRAAAFDVLSAETPVPEPATLLMVGTVLAGFGAVRRRS